jgi:hypothetical protein
LAGFSRQRAVILAAACGLGLGAWLVMRLVAPAADPIVGGAVAIAAFGCCCALALALDEGGVKAFMPIGVCCAVAVLIVALTVRDPEQMGLLFGFGSVGLMVFGGYGLARSARRRPISHIWRNGVIGLALAAALGLYCFYYVAASRDLMFGDFMYRRIEAIIIASMIDKGQIAGLIRLWIGSIKDEYSLLAPLAPGVVLSVVSASSRAWYQAALIALYAAPAYFALGVLARDLAQRAGLDRSSLRSQAWVLALALAAVVAAYPTGVAVVARGMPDVGGLVLVVAALRLSERLARLLALPQGHDARIGRLTRRVGFALALALFGMFLFRRWYAFAAVGILAMLAFEIATLAVIRRAAFRWRDAIAVAALAGLVLLALCAPILIDWLPNPATHDYVTIYAAYRKSSAVVIAELFDWYGAGLLVLAGGCAAFLAFRPGDHRLLRLTLGSTLIAALLFLRVQSPAIHHAYLLAPAVAAAIGAAILVMQKQSRAGALAALAALAVATLTPAVGAWAPAGLAPTAGRPPSPRSDLAELARLKAWVGANAAHDHRYCVIASSYTINDAIVDELWQMEADGLPDVVRGVKTNVGMRHVDTRDGPPGEDLKDCALMLVGDPVQTHLVPAYQQTVIVPASEMLAGTGIGSNYRRSGETFAFEKGVKLVVFERIRPLDDGDIAALQARWRAAREAKDAVKIGSALQ